MKFSRRGFLERMFKGTAGAAGVVALAPELLVATEKLLEKEPVLEQALADCPGVIKVRPEVYRDLIWEEDTNEVLIGWGPGVCPPLPDANDPQWDAFYAMFDEFGCKLRREQNSALRHTISAALR